MCPHSCWTSQPAITTHASVFGACGTRFEAGFVHVHCLCRSSERSCGGGAILSPILQMKRLNSESLANVSKVTHGLGAGAGTQPWLSAEP